MIQAQDPDACVRAIDVADGYSSTINTTGFATSNGTIIEPGWTQGALGAHDGGVHESVWYRYVGQGLPVQFSTSGSAFDTEMVINSTSDGSCNIATYTAIAATDDAIGACCDARLTILGVQDVVYYILVDGQVPGQVGNVAMTVTEYDSAYEPLDVTVSCADNTSFTLTGVNTDGVSLGSIQWQRASSEVGPFTDIPGASSQTYILDPVSTADGGDYFRAVYTLSIGNNSFPGATSSAALLTVNVSAIDFTVNTIDESAPDADDGTITFSNLSGASSYETSINDGANWSTDLVYSNLPDADYIVNVRDASNTPCAGEKEVVTVAAGAVLPVALTAFTGRIAGKQNLLKWAVAREEAFSHYEVERSPDGSNNWEILGEVAGAENARNGQAYNFSDLTPLPSTYYRLRMVDQDGSFTFSNILQLQREVEGKILVYPNPNNGSFTVQLPTGENAQLTLINLNGKVVWQGNSSDVSVTTNDLPSGIYLLSAETTAARLTQRVIVR